MSSKKELQSLVDSSRKALKKAEDKVENLKEEKDIAQNNNTLILKQNRILKSIIREIKLVAESNTYSNDKVALRKIKELASTGIDN